jgi:hypothetical protein
VHSTWATKHCMYTFVHCMYTFIQFKNRHKPINVYIHVWTMYVHVYSLLCTYHVHTVYIRVHEIAKMYVHAWNMYMIFHFCIYHVCQPLSTGTVHRLYIHTWNMYVHVYTMWSGFQMSGILTPWYPDIYSHIPSYDGIEWYMKVYDGYIRIMPPSSFHTWG